MGRLCFNFYVIQCGFQIELWLKSDCERTNAAIRSIFCCWFIGLMRTVLMGYNCCTHSNVWKLNFNYFQFNLNDLFPDSKLRRDPYLCLQSNRVYHTTEVYSFGYLTGYGGCNRTSCARVKLKNVAVMGFTEQVYWCWHRKKIAKCLPWHFIMQYVFIVFYSGRVFRFFWGVN